MPSLTPVSFGSLSIASTAAATDTLAFNVKSYGALGDGSHDDASAIQAAIDAASAAGGGAVLIPEGTYIIGTAIRPRSYVRVVGIGQTSILKIKSGADINGIQTPDIPTYATLANLSLDCNKAGNPTGSNGYGILAAFDHSLLDGVYVYNCKKSAIDLSQVSAAQYLTRIRNCEFGSDGVAAQLWMQDAWFYNNYVYNTNANQDDTTNARCLVVVGGPYDIVSNHFQNGAYNLYMNPPQLVRLRGNHFELANRSALRLDSLGSGGDGQAYWEIVGNTFAKASQAGTGLYPYISLNGFDSTHRVGDLAIVGNNFWPTITTPSYAVDVNLGVRITIADNAWNGAYSNTNPVNLTNSDRILVYGNAGDNKVNGTLWHEVGSAGEPAFLNSWVNFDGTHQTAGFRLDAEGYVCLKGLCKSGTIGAFNAMFVLPAGYRPTSIEHFITNSNGTAAELYVDTNGNVVPNNGSNVYMSLAGIRFKAA